MITPWQKTKEEGFSAGFRKLIKKTFILPNWSEDTFDIKAEWRAACILALTKANNVILVKQFRPGPEKVLLELPGGSVEFWEEPLEAAKRELLEETGYTGDVVFVGTSLDDAYSTLLRYNFIAKNCEKISEQNLDSNEFIETVEISLADFRKHIQSGELTDVESGYLCLDFLGLL